MNGDIFQQTNDWRLAQGIVQSREEALLGEFCALLAERLERWEVSSARVNVHCLDMQQRWADVEKMTQEEAVERSER